MNPAGMGKALLLLTVANGTPVVAAKLLGRRFARPLDGGAVFFDGRPLFGRSKTGRGIGLAVLAAAAAAPLLGVGWGIGALIGGAAMAGDLLSSFAKRRLGVAASGMAPGLDQIPELLLPLLAACGPLALGAADIALGVGLFVVGEIVLSRLLYRLHLRDRPY